MLNNIKPKPEPQSYPETLRIFENLITYTHIKEIFGEALDIILKEHIYRNDAQYPTTVNVGPTSQPYVVDYHGRRHVFAYNNSSTAVTLVSSDGLWNAVLPAYSATTGGTWVNISFPPSTRLSSSTAGQFSLKCTNEAVP